MNTGTDIVSIDVVWSKVLQVYVRCHLRIGALTLLLGVANEGNPDFGIRSLWNQESLALESGMSLTTGVRNPSSFISDWNSVP